MASIKNTKVLGRPSIYNEDLAKLICERVAVNPVGIEALCKLYPDLPDHSTIKAWRKLHPLFSSWYLEAKALQAQLLVEDIDDLLPNEVQYYIDERGNKRIDAPSASMLIAKINNRKWTAARLAPKIYGDRKTEENNSPEETLSKIKELVADLNKTDSNND